MQLFRTTSSISSLTINNQAYTNGKASFGPSQFSISAEVAVGLDAGPTNPSQGCNTIVSNVTGKIALVDRGTCSFGQKAAMAQQAGAVGILICNNAAGIINP